MELNSYELSRAWFDFCFENPEKIKPNHTSMYFFAVEHCNRLGWKEKFGFPSTMVMEAIGMKSYNTYINTLNDLINFGFIKLIEKSKNQYSSNIIALSKFNKAHNKALDKALIKHVTKQSESTCESIDSIIKQINNKQFNKEQITRLKKYCDEFLNKKSDFNFKNSLLDLGIDEQILNDWLEVRKKKKASNTKTAFTKFITQVNLSGLTVNECVRICAERDWKGFEAEWLKNLNDNGNGSTKKQQPATTVEDLIEINKKHFG